MINLNSLAVGISFLVVAMVSSAAIRMNGFVIDDDSLIPARDIHSGGPPKDGIPAIEKPEFSPRGKGEQIDPDDRVLGLIHQGTAKAYPISIMNWHEIVNDRFGEEPVVVTYCPLCGSGVAYLARVKGMEVSFGVSGLLYNSDVLLYDRQTESLWSQIMSRSVSGPMKGTRLKMLALTHTNWADWKASHPDTLLLSRQTGFRRDYDKDPYSGYENSSGTWFPVKKKDPRFHPKERVLGVELDGLFKAYPFSELSKTSGAVTDTVAGQVVTLVYNEKADSARIVGSDNREIPAITSFWFAWYAFHPETEVYRAP